MLENCQPGRLRLAFSLALAVLALGPGCATQGTGAGWVSTVPYTKSEAELFDDRFRPEVFGLEQSVEPPEKDSRLSWRTTSADSVFAAKVVTLTRGGNEKRASYTVVVESVEALAGKPVIHPLSLTIPSESPVFLWIEGVQESWVGSSVVLFVKSFADGLHYHATTDTTPVRKAIEQAAVNGVLSG